MGTGRSPCCDKNSVKKGPWSPAEDLRLAAFIQKNGHGNWRSLPKQAGLMRCGKSCRLRWINYLSPNVKRGNFTLQEEEAIIKLHNSYGNKWSKIAAELPGRTDNEIKNVWNTHLKKRLLVDRNSKCDNNNYNNAKQKKYYKTSSFSATSNSCGGVQSQEDKRQITSDPVVEMPIQNCTMSRSSSFTSKESNFSSSTTQVCDQVEKPSKEVEPLLGFSEDIMDHEFDIWSVLEDFDKFEAQQEQEKQRVASHLQGVNFEDENYIMDHDIELAEKSEWYRYLENNELGLMAIIGDQNHNFSQNEQATNGLFEEMRLEPDVDLDMNCFQYCPPSPHYI